MTYDHELTLIDETYTDDDIGNQVPEEIETVILCGRKSVGRTEFYKAAVTGLRPDVILVVHGYEYAGQKKCIFEGSTYKIIRTYEVDFEEVELTCERVIADGN